MQQQKFITSHHARVKIVNEMIIPTLPEKISIFDREALVEFLLLEQIERLYLYRFGNIKNRNPQTDEGKFYQQRQLEKVNYMIYMLRKCIEVMQGKIDEGAYSDVWKAIHEHQLIVASRRMEYLDELVDLVEDMLGDVSKEALMLAQKKLEGGEFLENLKAHEANVRRVKGLTPAAEVNAMLEAEEVSVPSADPITGTRINLK